VKTLIAFFSKPLFLTLLYIEFAQIMLVSFGAKNVRKNIFFN